MSGDLRSLTEKFLGTDLNPREWKEGKEAGERKLKRIIDSYGDEGGARRQPEYLAQLIAEAVRGNRLTAFCLDLAETYREFDKMIGIKKERPTHKRAGHSPAIPIVNQSF